MSAASFSSPSLSRVSARLRASVARARDRRDHDQAMMDPRVRAEHDAARSRATGAGQGDCPYCS